MHTDFHFCQPGAEAVWRRTVMIVFLARALTRGGLAAFAHARQGLFDTRTSCARWHKSGRRLRLLTQAVVCFGFRWSIVVSFSPNDI